METGTQQLQNFWDTLPSTITRRIERTPNIMGCWTWTGAVSWNNYGRIYLPATNRRVRIYRHVLGLFNGRKVPSHLQVDHLCHNQDIRCPGGKECLHRRCCNPAHLRTVKQLTNIEAYVERRRTIEYLSPLEKELVAA